MEVTDWASAKNLVLPVSVDSAGENARHGRVGERNERRAGVLVVLVRVQHEVLRIEKVVLLCELCSTGVGLDRELRLRSASLFRGDDDHAVGATCAVNGGSRRVLQNTDGFDVTRVDRHQWIGRSCAITSSITNRGATDIVLDGKAVDDIERLGVARDGRCASDAD